MLAVDGHRSSTIVRAPALNPDVISHTGPRFATRRDWDMAMLSVSQVE